MVVGSIQLIALSIVTDHYVSFSDMIGGVIIYSTIAIWVAIFLAIPCETRTEIAQTQVEDLNMTATDRDHRPKKDTEKFCRFWQKKKVGPDPEYLEMVKQNKNRLNF